MPPPDATAAGPWFALADADLAVARWIVAQPAASAELYGLACFHGQQAAEKAIKGVLAVLDLPQPHSHDLHMLLKPCLSVRPPDEAVLAATDGLADYGVGPRYPGPQRAGSHALARRALADAELVVTWARTQVSAG
jgi:HEPN domain-containing protein